MPNFKNRLDDFMLSSKVLIENTLSDSEIKTLLQTYGYNDEKLNKGKSLYDDAVNFFNKQKKEYGEQIEATDEVNKSWEKADVLYIKTLKVARVALQNNVKANTAMMINGSRKQSLSGWLGQAEAFYKNLTGDEILMAEMQKFGYTTDKLNTEYALIKDVIDKNLKQKKEMGEAQEATETRDKKIDELDKWLSDFRAIVKIALSENPQKLEKLGITVKTDGTTSKKKTTTDQTKN